MYRVELIPAAERHLEHLPHDIIPRIDRALQALSHTPRSLQSSKLEGHPSAYRLRVGDYRILYTIDDAQRVVTIFKISHRREAYR